MSPFRTISPRSCSSLLCLLIGTFAISAVFALGGCGGKGGSVGGGGATPPAGVPSLSLSYGIKTLRFSWVEVPGATYYNLFEDPDGLSGYSQVGGNISATSYDHGIFLPKRVNARYTIKACNSGGCGGDSTPVNVSAALNEAIGYAKASNTDAGDFFGISLALSADGNTLAVGADGEASNATGINGDQTDNSASNAGAVYVYTRAGSTWVQQAYIKASNTEGDDYFGSSLALSADGSTLAVGAEHEDSNATGINGDQNDNSTTSSGAAYVFVRSGATWSQQAYIKASNTDSGDRFGDSLALSSDGDTLAVGAYFEDSNATGVGGNQGDSSTPDSGVVYVFTRSGATWSQQAYIKASNTDSGDFFGHSLGISADGNTLAVGAMGEGSSATGIGGDQSDNSAAVSGAVYMFTRSGITWSQQAYIKASNTGANDYFGTGLGLSADGNTLAVGAPGEASNATGIGGDQSDNTAAFSGAVYMFTRSGITWSQQAYIKASNSDSSDFFGDSLALSPDGNTLAVGALFEDSSATGIGGNESDNSAADPNAMTNLTGAGAAYVFLRSGIAWSQQAYVKASNTDTDDWFGRSLALSSDGNTLVVGAVQEDSNATGIGSNQNDNTAALSGAVYLY